MTDSFIDTVDADATAAFKVLNSEARLAILLALWEAHDPDAVDNSVSFSALRERVGIQDSGQFNYHLRQLEGQFVEKTETGYTLRPVGLKLVGTVIAGTGDGPQLDPVVVDVPCYLCRAPSAITYQNGWLYQVCTECDGGFTNWPNFPEGALFGEPLPPAALVDRTPEEIFAAAVFQLLTLTSLKMGGLCPRCSGEIETTIQVCENHETPAGRSCPDCGFPSEIRLRWVCPVCKYAGGSSPAGAVILHPAVVAFYHDHGVSVSYEMNEFERAREVLELLRSHEQELVATDPLEVEVTVRCDDDELRLLLDESMSVVDVENRGAE